MSDELATALDAIGRALPGTLGVAIRYLPDGPEMLYNADERFPPASVIKVPVLIEVFAQSIPGSGSVYANAIAFGLLVLVLVTRPQGLMGRRP